MFNERIAREEISYDIIKLAHVKGNFDMIVIGSRGQNSTKEILFCSVSNHVIHTPKILVAIVK